MAPIRQVTPLGLALVQERRTQVWLAAEVGVQPRAAWTWVHGIHEPDEDTKPKIARALDRTVDDLFPPDDERRAA